MAIQEEYEIYGGFAQVYDKFMDNIPYDSWFAYVEELLEEQGIVQGTVVDLACGTGEITRRLQDKGYHTIGVDLSEDMLCIAREKCSPEVLLLQQDMRRLELAHNVQAMVCICDGMNYLLDRKELEQVFQRVENYLEPGGIFLFDMKTDYFYREILGNRILTDNREDASYIWENEYDCQTGLNEYLLTVYELVDDERDLFVRTDELHRQKAFSVQEVMQIAREWGLELCAVYEAFSRKEPKEDSERVYFIMKKQESEDIEG